MIRPQLLRPLLGLVAAAAVLAAGPAPVSADVVTIDFQGWNEGIGWSSQVTVPIAPTGPFSLEGWSDSLATLDVENFDIAGNADPFIDFGFSFRNTSNVVETFTVTITLPVIVNWAASTAGGSIGVTLTDANFSGGATFASDGTQPVYLAKIDGNPLHALMDEPYTLSTAVLGGSIVGNDSFGLPGFTFPSGPLTSSMEVVLNFTLSPGDRAVVTGTFAVIPEPGTGLVVGLGALALVIGGRVRRRAAG